MNNSEQKQAYKIKMYCTQADQLVFNNKPITIKSGQSIQNKLLPNDNISEIFILYKDKNFFKNKNNKKKAFCIKSIEFACEELTEHEFILFITKMQYVGFYSGMDTKIQFINMTDNKIIYEYSFQTIVKQTPKPRIYCRNTSTYRHVSLYKKNSNYNSNIIAFLCN
jgi:hypothetical protein